MERPGEHFRADRAVLPAFSRGGETLSEKTQQKRHGRAPVPGPGKKILNLALVGRN
jgi:hypothetical protein